jgi:DivIVA domain-containing protein
VLIGVGGIENAKQGTPTGLGIVAPLAQRALGAGSLSVDRDTIDRIRSANFPVGRRGYDKREVDRFLSELADWLETGGADRARAELLRREVHRIGRRTSKILAEAHGAGEEIRAEAKREATNLAEATRGQAATVFMDALDVLVVSLQARVAVARYAGKLRAEAHDSAAKALAEAEAHAARIRTKADAYSATTRRGADAYAAKTRAEIEATAARTRARADHDAEQAVEKARAEAKRIVEQANQRRGGIESVISDLEQRREAVLAVMEQLAGELTSGAIQHRLGSPDPEAARGPSRPPPSKTT